MSRNRDSLSEQFSRIAYVHGPDVAGIAFMLFAAALELACGYSIGFDNPIAIIAYHAALAFVVMAVFLVWGIVRFEQRYNR